jgi:hypothetical protein
MKFRATVSIETKVTILAFATGFVTLAYQMCILYWG